MQTLWSVYHKGIPVFLIPINNRICSFSTLHILDHAYPQNNKLFKDSGLRENTAISIQLHTRAPSGTH